MRHLGKICTNVRLLNQQYSYIFQVQLYHIREMAVIEVIARSAKLLIKDGLTFLADDEDAGFKSDNIKKCILHYLLEIFNMDEYRQTSTQNIWDFITEHVMLIYHLLILYQARKKFQITVERDVLHKIHLNSLLSRVCNKLNIQLNINIKDIDFFGVDE